MFYLEYFKFEIAFLLKIRQRKEILKGGKNENLEFVEDEPMEEQTGEGEIDSSTNIAQIVYDTIVQKFG